MDPREKVLVDKNEDIDSVLEKLVNSTSARVVLNVPRFAKFAESEVHFKTLKEQTELLGKELIIESVDDRVINICDENGIQCYNPFFIAARKQFSDIVPKGKKSAIAPLRRRIVLEEETEKEKEIEKVNKKSYAPLSPKPSFLKLPSLPSFKFPVREIKGWKKISLLSGIAIIGVFTFFFIVQSLSRAEIVLQMKKIDWTFSDNIVASKNFDQIDAEESFLPGQFFAQQKNVSLFFQANGKKRIERKSSGIITVYNAYSSQSQALVQKTRFETPDGKIFRLVKNIVIPGAKVTDGKIIPSSIDTEVIADVVGESYNIGPISHFSIPGLKGGLKYDGFYGESKSPMSGGFVGEAAFPTDEDVKNAKVSITNTLREALFSSIKSQLPPELKILDNTVSFAITKQTVNTDTVDGKFSVFAEAELKTVAFKESQLLDLFQEKILLDLGRGYIVKSYDLEYGIAALDAATGSLTMPIQYKAVVAQDVNLQSLRQQVKGKSENELRSTILTVPGLDKANASLWPRWVSKVPNNDSKITIKVE